MIQSKTLSRVTRSATAFVALAIGLVGCGGEKPAPPGTVTPALPPFNQAVLGIWISAPFTEPSMRKTYVLKIEPNQMGFVNHCETKRGNIDANVKTPIILSANVLTIPAPGAFQKVGEADSICVAELKPGTRGFEVAGPDSLILENAAHQTVRFNRADPKFEVVFVPLDMATLPDLGAASGNPGAGGPADPSMGGVGPGGPGMGGPGGGMGGAPGMGWPGGGMGGAPGMGRPGGGMGGAPGMGWPGGGMGGAPGMGGGGGGPFGPGAGGSFGPGAGGGGRPVGPGSGPGAGGAPGSGPNFRNGFNFSGN